MCLLCPSVLSKSTSLFDFRQDQRHTDGSKRFDCPRFWHTWATASVSTHHAGCLSLGLGWNYPGQRVDTRGSEPRGVASASGLGRQKACLAGLGPGSLGSIVGGDQAYRCRLVIGAEPGYSAPGFLLVSRGLRKSRWPARLMTAATGQRFTTEECFRDQKSDWYEGFQPRRGLVRHPGAWGPVLVGVCLGLLMVEWERMDQGTDRHRSGMACESREKPPNPCVVA